MAMQLGGKGGVKSDINVTPLVDVMLVLLIIMMLIAPMLQQGVAVQMPEAANTGEKPDTQDQTVVAIDSQGRFFVNGVPVREEELRQRVEDIVEDKTERIVLIKADEDAQYSVVMAAMDQLRAAGIEDMGLITDPKQRPGQAGGGT